MIVDDFATQDPSASAAMILTHLAQNIPLLQVMD